MTTGKTRRKVTQDFFKEKQIDKMEWACCESQFTTLGELGRHVNLLHLADLDLREQKEEIRLKEIEDRQNTLSKLRQRRGEKGSSDPISVDCDCDLNQHKVILFYRYVSIKDPVQFALLHQELCRDMHGKVRIAKEGINATLAGPDKEIDTYLDWLTQTEAFADTPSDLKLPQSLTDADSPRYRFFKPSKGCKHVFLDLSIKAVDEICPLGQAEIALNKLSSSHHRSGKLSPQDFHDLLQKSKEKEEFLLLDTRNYYESKIGHFDGAVKPAIRKFSQFPDFIDRNKEAMQGKRILTYCTGGIRCEKATAYMRHALPEDTEIFMLDGGIHNYLEWWGKTTKESSSELWKGKNYVFDARQSLGMENTKAISQCEKCKKPWDQYTKCTSPHCHLLILYCNDCITASAHCCIKCEQSEKACICLCEEKRRQEEHTPISK
ncbi:Rhodanese-like domain-containing protein [Sporodiniella umbellata]|nr:Rhodanese-like domain-containing protein [Sporodiniella umbellata]